MATLGHGLRDGRGGCLGHVLVPRTVAIVCVEVPADTWVLSVVGVDVVLSEIARLLALVDKPGDVGYRSAMQLLELGVWAPAGAATSSISVVSTVMITAIFFILSLPLGMSYVLYSFEYVNSGLVTVV